MKATIAFSIALHRINQLVPFFIEGTTGCLEVFARLCEIVVIDEVIACVIRRVYVDHLDCAKIVLAENFEHIEVIALNVEIFGVPKIFGGFKVRSKGFVCLCICET